MSETSLPASNGQYKPLPLLDESLPMRTVYGVLRVGEPLKPMPRPAITLQPPAKPEAAPSTYSPIKHTLYSLQAFGFTHPSHGNFLKDRYLAAREGL